MRLLGMLFAFLGFSFADTYGSALERYIVSRNPQDVGDIERLTQEFDRRQQERFL